VAVAEMGRLADHLRAGEHRTGGQLQCEHTLPCLPAVAAGGCDVYRTRD
jgi:hypothetical protein